jgi:DNA-binding CsgD family transcriptional regulator
MTGHTLGFTWEGERSSLAFVSALLDALPDGARLVLPNGHVVAENAALSRWMQSMSDHALAEASLDRVRRDVIERLQEFCEDPRRVVSYERLPAALIAARPVASERRTARTSCVLLTVRPDRGEGLTSGDVAVRFGLTLRQAEVAILLARGARNDTVALALGVSASTARRHTEAVLARLAVRSRSEVAAVLSARQEGGEAA